MSLPPELRVLCHLLSNTPINQLPRITPILLRHVSCCQGPLSAAPIPSKSDSSEESVLVHKLRTLISTMLHGKSAEGRFVAASLIKSVVETGGWEVLRGVESWVRGLLAILSKRDSVATMRISILALTKIYIMTHQYQSLVREITTPTLPTFVSSCLRLASPQLSGGKQVDPPLSLMEICCDAFSALLPRHPAIFRPFTKQIYLLILPCLAPTLSDQRFVPSSLVIKARRLRVLLYQTAAKNAGGEEWTKGTRELVLEVHRTTNLVFRPIVEDWESAAGYISQSVDVNEELHGGGDSEANFSLWTGMSSGLERLTGLFGLLEEHFTLPTPTAVAIPLGAIVDLLTRILSVTAPTSLKGGSNYGAVRPNPAIERVEREELFCGLPAVHIAAMQVYLTLADRLGTNFTSLAQGTLDQLTWTFAASRHDEEFRATVYRLVSKLLPLVGSSLSKASVAALIPILKSCVKDLDINGGLETEANGKSATNTNFDHFLVKDGIQLPGSKSADVVAAASGLLPLLISHLPQQYLREQDRAEIDRTAILCGHRDAMVASILNPFTKKNGTTFYSILPHLSRLFPEDEAVELSLRPRAPMIAHSKHGQEDESIDEELPDDDVMEDVATDVIYNTNEKLLSSAETPRVNIDEMVIEPARNRVNLWDNNPQAQLGSGGAGGENAFEPTSSLEVKTVESSMLAAAPRSAQRAEAPAAPLRRAELTPSATQATPNEDTDDSDESVHLNMEMSESEEEEDDKDAE